MKIILLIGSILMLRIPSFAQAPDTMWTKTFGDAYVGGGENCGDVQVTSDGGYLGQVWRKWHFHLQGFRMMSV